MPSVAVHNDGTIEYTRNQELQGFFNDRGEMVRITDICKFKHSGEYYFVWLEGPYKDMIHTHGIHADIYETQVDTYTDHTIVVFNSYEETVAYERMVLEAMRKRGIKFSK